MLQDATVCSAKYELQASQLQKNAMSPSLNTLVATDTHPPNNALFFKLMFSTSPTDIKFF